MRKVKLLRLLTEPVFVLSAAGGIRHAAGLTGATGQRSMARGVNLCLTALR